MIDDYQPDENAMLVAALAAYDAGLCPIRPRTDGSKAPLAVRAHGKLNETTGQREPGWESFQSERPNRVQVEAWFGAHPGLGLVCGAVSGQLEMLELEGRAIAEGLGQELIEAVDAAGLTPVLERIGAGYTERTPSGGLHWLFRVGDGPALGSLKLAQRLATPGELAERPRSPLRALIETKAEGGFVIVAPSNGTTHPTGGSWTLTHGGFASIATVTAAERDALYEVCRTLDRLERTAQGIAKVPPVGLAHQHRRYDGGPIGGSWMGAVEAHLETTDAMAGALERYGWRDLKRTDSQNCPLYERPDQEHPGQNGAVINKSGRLVVYTTSTPFESVLATTGHGRTYSLLDVYAAYEHQGDRQLAARVIAEQTGIYGAWLDERDPRRGHDPADNSTPGDSAQKNDGSLPAAFRRYSTAELLAEDRTTRWDIIGMLATQTYGLDGGELKTLKSYVGLARTVSLAAGVPMLGHWKVPERRRVLAFVAEGGRKPFTTRLERMAAAHGVKVSDLDGWLEVIFEVAPLDSRRFREALTAALIDFGPGFVWLDPLYPFQPATVSSSQLSEVGAMLTAAHLLCGEHGATLWVTTHMNQTGSGFDLKRINGAGPGEWADSWALLKHRTPPEVQEGRFRLQLDIGSRQWGGSSWDLDLNIGRFMPDLGVHDGPITFAVRLANATSSGPDAQGVHDKRIEEAGVAMNRVASKRTKPFTKTEIIDDTVGSAAVKRAAFARLVDAKTLVEVGTTGIPFGSGTRQVLVFLHHTHTPAKP